MIAAALRGVIVDLDRHVLESPVALPAAPLSVGVVEFVEESSAGDVKVTAGALVSTVNVFAELVAVLPVVLVCVACTVYVPWASFALVDQVAPERVTFSVWWSVPPFAVSSWILTVTLLESPVALPAAPLSVGVMEFVEEPSAGDVSVTAGALCR